MVYGGPKKGYEIKMEEVETTPVDSETEDDEDRVSLAPSEYMDTESPVVRLDDGIHEISTAAKKKLEKAWCAAEELVETERRYVAKLHLLASVSRFLKIALIEPIMLLLFIRRFNFFLS